MTLLCVIGGIVGLVLSVVDLIVYLCFVDAIEESGNGIIMILIFMVLFAIGIISLIAFTKKKKVYVNVYKQIVVEKTLKDRFDNFSFNANDGFRLSHIEVIHLFRKRERDYTVKSEDLI